MANCSAATATAAIFTALIVLDIVNKNYNQILLHISGGVFSVIGIFLLCNVLGETMAWGFLAVPFIVLLVGFLLLWIDTRKDQEKGQEQEQGQQEQCADTSVDLTCCPPPQAKPMPEPPLCKASSQTVLPSSVTNIPPRNTTTDLGCPTKPTKPKCT